MIAKGCGEVQRMNDKGCVVSFYDENVLKLDNSDGCTTPNVLKTHWIYPLQKWLLWYVSIWIKLLLKEKKGEVHLILAQIT